MEAEAPNHVEPPNHNFRIADRLWIAAALLHQSHPSRATFSKSEIWKGSRRRAWRRACSAGHSTRIWISIWSRIFRRPPVSTECFLKHWTVTFACFGREISHILPGCNCASLPSYFHGLRRSRSATTICLIGTRIGAVRIRFRRCRTMKTILSFASLARASDIWADEHADEYVENLRREDR